MTPKEKAHELIDKIYNVFVKDEEEHHIGTAWRISKQCALIAVDEILSSFDSFMDSRRNFRHELEIEAERYWQQVRTEIENL